MLTDFRNEPAEVLRTKYALPADGRDWTIPSAKNDIQRNDGEVIPITYRIFDQRFTYYTGRSRAFLGYPRNEVMRHIVGKENIALLVNRQTASDAYSFVSLSKHVAGHGTHYLGNRGQDYVCPLYLYPEEGTLETERRVNFDPQIYAEIRERAGLSGVDGDELKVFDYIYGVLHSPDYRATYAQFLKIDFPRIPYPASPEVFAHVAEKGGQLRRLHLMEDAVIGATPYPFSGDGDNVVEKPTLSDDCRVYINPNQYFENVPALAWEFHIGGYQPAQKWLKDRKGRALSFDDVLHYQKIIKILTETDRIMKEITLPL